MKTIFIETGAFGLGALVVVGPPYEAAHETAENCQLSAPCSWGQPYQPDEPPVQHGGETPILSLNSTFSSSVTMSAGALSLSYVVKS
jgi:hypothetical protein